MLIVETPPTRTAERLYVLSVLLRDELGLEFTVIEGEPDRWRLSLDGADGAVTMPDTLLGVPKGQWLKPASLPSRRVARWSMPRSIGPPLPAVPMIYGREDFSTGNDETALPVDVFGSAFFMLTRYEELVVAASDAHERFPAAASLAVQEGFNERPVVNELLDALWHAFERLWPGLQRRQRGFSIELSHDVDWLSSVRHAPLQVARLLAGDVGKRRDPELFARRLAAAARAAARRDAIKDPVDTFEFIMAESESRGIRSVFNFIAGADRRPPFHNDTYSLDSAATQRLLASIGNRGHEIGLHGSYGAWKDAELLGGEFRLLQDAARRAGVEQAHWGGRQHFLRFAAPETWAAWNAVGLEYDSSVGYAEAPGFRCGLAGPFRVFDLKAGAPLDLVERPLVAMEGSFFGPQYGGLSFGESITSILALAETCRRHRGTFTLLWHNTSLARRAERDAYSAVLDGLCALH